MIEIREVKNKKELKAFIDFPIKLYKDCKYFTPYIYEDEVVNLTSKNPAREYCDFKCFLAYKDGKVVGRICGIISHLANQKYHQNRVRFNRIDMINDFEVTKALIEAVETWAKENKLDEINGPLGFSDQDKEGLLVYGFDQENMFATFYTYPYYVKHLEKLGFEVETYWKEFKIIIPQEVPKALKRISSFVAKKEQLHIVELKNKHELKKYIKPVLRLTNKAYKNLYGYVEIDEDQMDTLAKQYIKLININHLHLICNKDDELIAYGLGIPSPSMALKEIDGHLMPLGFIKFLRALKEAPKLDLLLIAVEPKLRDKGIPAMIFEKGINACIKDGIRWAETGPMLFDNYPIQNVWKKFDPQIHKKRACFIKKIS